MAGDYQYIDDDAALAEFCAALGDAEFCAIDTEFVRESTYYAELALIQVGSGAHMGCIDPLAITDFAPLVALLQNAGLVKVFHSCSQDLEILFHKFGSVPAPVFDTQLAAAVLGYNHQISYAELVHRICGVSLDKKHTRANWMRRPLSDGELDYAMDDVRYLQDIYTALKEQLRDSGRESWMERDLRALSDPATYQVDEAQLWKRLKGVQKLKGERLQIASDRCRWREALARKQNRPRRWIAKDDALIQIARQKPASQRDLSSLPELSDKTVRRHGEDLLAIVARAGEMDPSQWPSHDKIVTLDKQQLALGDCLMALCRLIADENDVALATLALRKDVDNLILNQKSSRLTQGWRYQMAGEKLLEFIHGQSGLRVEGDRLRLEPRDR